MAIEEKKAAVAAPVDKTEEAVKRGVDSFVTAHLRNSDFSRDTPAWNHFIAGLPVLVDSIVREVKGL